MQGLHRPPQRPPPPPPPPSPRSCEAGEVKISDQLKLVTLNIFSMNSGPDWPRIRRQVEMLQNLDADVICLQEVFQPEVREHFRASFPGYRSACETVSLQAMGVRLIG